MNCSLQPRVVGTLKHSAFSSGNAVPTPFLPRLCLLVYFSVVYVARQYKLW